MVCVWQLSSTTEVLSSALKSQWDAQHAANQHNQDKVSQRIPLAHTGAQPSQVPSSSSDPTCTDQRLYPALLCFRCPSHLPVCCWGVQLSVVLSRVDSVLDRTAAALSSGQSTLQAADDALQQAKANAATRRAQLQRKRRGKEADSVEEEEEDEEKRAPSAPPAVVHDEKRAESDEEPASQVRQLRPSRRTRGQTSTTTDGAQPRVNPAMERRRLKADEAEEEKEDTTSPADRENVEAMTRSNQQPPAAAPPLLVPPVKSSVSTTTAQPPLPASSAAVAGVDVQGKKRKLSNLPLPLAPSQPSANVSDGRAPLQPIGVGIGSRALVGFSHGATSISAAAPRSLAPTRNLFMSFLQGANAMKAPKLKV